MSKYDYETSNNTSHEEPIYLSSSDEDENIPNYTQQALDAENDTEPVSDEEVDTSNNINDEDDEDSYIPTAKSSLSHNNANSEDESEHSDTDYDGPTTMYGDNGHHRRPIKVYDEYDPENLDMDDEDADDDEASPSAKYKAMRRASGSNAAKSRTSLFANKQTYQV